MDRRPEELPPELDGLSDDALNQLAEGIPRTWLDVAVDVDGGGLDALAQAEEGAELDPAVLHELLAGLGSEVEERLAARVVDDFLRRPVRANAAGGLVLGGAMAAGGTAGAVLGGAMAEGETAGSVLGGATAGGETAGSVLGEVTAGEAVLGGAMAAGGTAGAVLGGPTAAGDGPGFVDDELQRAEVIPIQSEVRSGTQARSVERRWWSVALPLAAAAIVLIALIDGPGLRAVFDEEGRVRPAELSPNATASAERGASRAKWSLAEAPVPGSTPGGAPGGELLDLDLEVEEEATISAPRGVPGGKGGAVGGALGGSVVGAAGGVAGGQKGEPVGGVLGGVVSSAEPSTPTPTKQSDVAERPTTMMPIDAVMAHSLYAPDPAPKALASTKAGMFDRRPCASRIRFCVDPRGRSVDVRSVDVRSVGACYDSKVDEICREAVEKWRFKPFIVAGEASQVCTEVSFALRFDKRR